MALIGQCHRLTDIPTHFGRYGLLHIGGFFVRTEELGHICAGQPEFKKNGSFSFIVDQAFNPWRALRKAYSQHLLNQGCRNSSIQTDTNRYKQLSASAAGSCARSDIALGPVKTFT